MNSELKQKLQQVAIKHCRRFCLSCYVPAVNGRCPECHSDDLAYERESSGVNWSVDFVIEELLQENLTSVDLDSMFEESMRDCYSDSISIGFLKNIDVCDAIRSIDPVAWDIARSEFESFEESDERIVSFDGGGTYYSTYEVEEYVENNLP